MSYCSSCGAYIPDWADECPACGAPKADTKKKSSAKKKTASSAAAAASETAKTSGEYHYSYKKAEKKTQDASSRGSYSSGDARRTGGDKGTFTYESSKRADGGTFTYDGSSRQDYEREYRRDAKKNRGLAALCYIGPFFLLSWLLKSKSSFVRYHVNQGLVLFLCWVIIGIFDFIPFMWAANIFAFVCVCLGLSNALKGKRKPLPLIGEINLIS